VESRPRDDELVAQAARGDGVAYEELVRRHQHLAFRLACVYAGSPSEAQDAVQEALLKAWRQLGRFDASRASFRTWLLTIVANEARSGRRSGSRWTARHERLAGQARTSEGAAPSAEVALLERERSATLLSVLDGLKPGDREVILLRFGLELSERDISEVLRCRPGTVKSRLSRATDRMREAMVHG
jgi:RNA polymerase sigma-70 factor (ECF subfamily)